MDAETLRARLSSGDLLDLRTGDPRLDDPAAADEWPEERDVPADLLAELLTAPPDGNIVRRRLQLAGARITGTLDLHSATLTRSLLLRQCRIIEPVVLHDADAQTLEFPGSHVPGIYATGCRCRGDLNLSDGFTAEGEVRLLRAHIGGQLNCSGGTFRNPGGFALNANRLTVDQAMFCSDGFTAEGRVRLLGARIGSQLDCTNGTFRNPGGNAIRLDRITIDADVLMRPTVLDCNLDLTDATVRAWRDDARTWPEEIRLSGFTYTHIEAQPESTTERLRWLRRDPAGYVPQPYEQLAGVYRREGHDAAARQVLIAKQRHRRASHPSRWRRWPSKAWSWLLWATIGYGYRPWLVLVPAFALFVLGWWLFDLDHRRNLITPTEDTQPTPTFHSARYTADLLLPVANLSERANFVATDAAAWHAFAFTLTGWVLAIVLVAGLTGIFKRD